MFNFSLKDIYDDNVSGYLLLIDFFKWLSIIFIALGLFLTFWFNDYWLAIIGGILLSFIGSITTIIIHIISKKLVSLANRGSSLVESTENYLKNQAKQQAKKLIDKK